MEKIVMPKNRPSNDYIGGLTDSFVIDAKKVALIVVDLQYATGSREAGLGKKLAQEGKLDQLAGERFERIENVVVPNTKKILAFFRQHDLPVIYITIGSEMKDFTDAPPHMRTFFKATNNRKGELEHEIVRDVSPLPDEIILNKTTISAFTSTGIDCLLRNMGIEYLLFVGVSTNMCVGTTARDAADRGYRCVIVEDCCGSAQTEYHLAEIVTYQRLFGRVDSSDNIIEEIIKSKKF